MKCNSSSLSSTIHLLVSPVIEERPLILSSAFQNQLLTSRRIKKSKNFQPPIQLTNDTLPFIKKYSIDSLTTNQSNKIKSRSLFGFFRKLIKKSNSLEQSSTSENIQQQEQQINILPPLTNKFFELNIDEKKPTILSESQIINNNNQIPLITKQEITTTATGQYIDMGPTIQKPVQNQQEEIKEEEEEEIKEESTSSVDVGVNSKMISFRILQIFYF